jgi:hypothetical protein
MRYVLIAYAARQATGSDPEIDPASTEGRRHSLGEDLVSGGFLIRSVLLRGERSATTVRVRDGRVTLSDGPPAGTDERLGGIYVIDARDLNDAVRAAARIPQARLGAVEVRPVREPT